MQERPRLLYPSMVIAAITVTVFSLLGIASISGVLPLAHSESAAAVGAAAAPSAESQYATLPPPPGAAPNMAYVEPCRSCGIVESVAQVETKGSSSGVGAVAGGLVGALLGNGMGHGNGRAAMTVIGGAGGAFAGNEIEKTTQKSTSFRIRVRMDDGTRRTLYQHEPPTVAGGDHVKIVSGSVVLQS